MSEEIDMTDEEVIMWLNRRCSNIRVVNEEGMVLGHFHVNGDILNSARNAMHVVERNDTIVEKEGE